MDNSGDSGTFGSKSQMNAIKKFQSQPIAKQEAQQLASQRSKFSNAGNKLAQAQLTGKAPWDKFSNKLFK